MEKLVDVIIVGAGLSGLSAAYELTQAGKTIAILEARDRIGGRIHTITTEDGRGGFDLGPTWFWGHNRYVIDFLQRFGVDYFEQYETGDNLFEQYLGTQPERFRQNWMQPTSYRFVGGTMALMTAIAEQLPQDGIHLKQVVQKISLADDDSVIVETNDQTWQAQTVIVTLPPHLAATTIRYTPNIPDNVLKAMRDTPTWMGQAMKVSLVYETPFWRKLNLSGMAVSYGGPVQQFQDATPADESVGALFGWVANHSPSREWSFEARHKAVIEQAVRLFGDQAAMPLHYDDLNWEREPFTTNTADGSRVLANEHPQYGHPLLQKPQLNGRLWWATTEASSVSGGYLDGAIYIGRAVATQILKR